MKKGMMLVVLVAFLNLGLASATDVVFDDYLFSGGSVTLNSLVFTLTLNSNNQQIWVNYDNKDAYINLNSCETFSFLRVCFLEVTYDTTELKYKAHVRVNNRIPILTLARASSGTSAAIDEELTININISNTGNVTARNVHYEEEIPEGFKFVRGTYLISDGKLVSWDGDVSIGTKELKYIIKAISVKKSSITGTLAYNNEIKDISVYSSAITFETTAYYSTLQIVGRSAELYPGRTFNYTFNISNLLLERVTSNIMEIDSLRIEFPSSVQVVSVPSGMNSQGDNTYKYSGNLYYNTTKRFNFLLKAKISGTYDIYPFLDYTRDGLKTQSELDKKSLTIEKKDIVITAEPTPNEQLDEHIEDRIKLYVRNTNPRSKITDVRIVTYTNLTYVPTYTVASMNQSESRKVYDIQYVTPEVASDTSFPVKVIVTYRTEFGEIYSKELKYTANIMALKDLTITQSVDDSNPDSGDTIRVSVKVKNTRQTAVPNVRVQDSIVPELPLSGVSSKVLTFNEDTLTDVYSYGITMPETAETAYYKINTTLLYEENGVSNRLSKSTTITLKPRIYSVSFTKALDDSEIYMGEPIVVKYTLRNTDTLAITNISLSFPADPAIDSFIRPYFLDKLNPGESVELTDVESLRFKFNRSIKVNRTLVRYIGANGLQYTGYAEGSAIVPKTTPILKPILLLNKTWDNNLTKIFVTNLGGSATDAIIRDNNQEWKISLDPISSKTLSYPTDELEYITSMANATYIFNLRNYTSYSNMVSYTPPTTTTTTSTSTTSTSTTTTTIIRKAALLVEDQPGFWSRIIDRFKYIFGIGK